jgi:hypothetical protein
MHRRVGAVGLLFASACSAILGIDFPPVRPGPDAGSAAPVCADLDLERDPCRCAHVFCRDFEDAGRELVDWKTPEAVDFENPAVVGVGAIELIDGGYKSTRALRFALTYNGHTSGAILFHALDDAVFGDPARLDGVRMVFQTRVLRSEVDAGGPIPGIPTSLVAGFVNAMTGNEAPNGFAGPMLVLGQHSVHLAVMVDFDPSNGRSGRTIARERVTRADFDIQNFLDTWGRVTIFSGRAGQAATLGYESCPAGDFVIAATFGVSSLCLAAPAGYDIAALAHSAVLVLGPLMKGGGTTTLDYDNVWLDVYSSP